MSLRSRSLELITDPATGKVSGPRVWNNVGSFAACVIFVRMGWNTTVLTEEMFAVFLAGMCGHAAVNKLLSLKYGRDAADKGTQ